MNEQLANANQNLGPRKSDKWPALIEQLAGNFEAGEQLADQTDLFVAANYEILREHGFFAALVPAECGGGM